MSNPEGEPDHSVSEPTTSASPEASAIDPTPAEDADRDLDISRRELRCLAEHLRRSRKHLDAHYDQLAWLNARVTERQAQLRQEEDRLSALVHSAEARRQEIEDQGSTLQEQQRQHQEASQTEQARLEQLRQQVEDQQRQAQEQQATARAELERQRQQFQEQQRLDRQRWTAEQAELEKSLADEGAQIAHQRQDIVEAEASLRLQREEWLTLKAEVAAAQERENKELADLRHETEALKIQLAESEDELARAADPEHEAPVASPVAAQPSEPDEEAAADESEELEPVPPISLATSVDELAAFCQQLEADQRAVEADLRQLQARQGKRDNAVLTSSAPTASLTRGKAQLTHLHEEIRQEMARLQRVADARGRLSARRTAQGTQRRPTGDEIVGAPGKRPTPTKTRGTFHGLRRWLGGKGG